MYQFLSFCVLAYWIMAIIWFLVEIFIFDKSFKRSAAMCFVWPYLAWKVRTGRKPVPNSFYSPGETHSEFKRNHHPDEVPPSAAEGDGLKTLPAEQKDERDEGGTKA